MPDLMLFALGGYLTVGLLIAAATTMTDPPGRGTAVDYALYGLALVAVVVVGPAVALFDLIRRARG